MQTSARRRRFAISLRSRHGPDNKIQPCLPPLFQPSCFPDSFFLFSCFPALKARPHLRFRYGLIPPAFSDRARSFYLIPSSHSRPANTARPDGRLRRLGLQIYRRREVRPDLPAADSETSASKARVKGPARRRGKLRKTTKNRPFWACDTFGGPAKSRS
jgi:hypothetical protein